MSETPFYPHFLEVSSEATEKLWVSRERSRREFLVVNRPEYDENDVMADQRLRIAWLLPGRDDLHILHEESNESDVEIVFAFLQFSYPHSAARFTALKHFLVLASRVNGVLSGARVFSILDTVLNSVLDEPFPEHLHQQASADTYPQRYLFFWKMIAHSWVTDFGQPVFSEILEQFRVRYLGHSVPSLSLTVDENSDYPVEDEEDDEYGCWGYDYYDDEG